MNYQIEAPTAPRDDRAVNGLADDLESWGFQVPALVEAGFRVLRFDNRGIGKSDRPQGPTPRG